MSTIAGDCLLSGAFIAYAGYFDQQMRQNLFTTWSHHLQQANIQVKIHRDKLTVNQFTATVKETLRSLDKEWRSLGKEHCAELYLLKMSLLASRRIPSQVLTVRACCSSVQTSQGQSTFPMQTSGFAGKQVLSLQMTCALRTPSCSSGLIGIPFEDVEF